MTFNAHANLWFDGLIAYAQRYDSGDTANVTDALRHLSRKPATRRNAVALTEMVAHVRDPALQAHARAVLDRQFKPEFRYAFSPRRLQVSAASELFSLIRQAVASPGRG